MQMISFVIMSERLQSQTTFSTPELYQSDQSDIVTLRLSSPFVSPVKLRIYLERFETAPIFGRKGAISEFFGIGTIFKTPNVFGVLIVHN